MASFNPVEDDSGGTSLGEYSVFKSGSCKSRDDVLSSFCMSLPQFTVYPKIKAARCEMQMECHRCKIISP